MTLKEEFDQNGVVLLPKLFHATFASAWLVIETERIASRVVNKFNPVEVDGEISAALRCAERFPDLLEAVGDALECIPAVYNFRLVVKDKHAENAVFLHQDCGYHIGSMPKLSAFVALSEVTPKNGGMVFWLGTHKFGYLGDVGEIDRKHLKGRDAIWPVLAPGDVVLMHSALWHESGPKVSGPDRVMADIIYQRGDDPARLLPRDGLFVRSRSSRLRELQAIVDAKV